MAEGIQGGYCHLLRSTTASQRVMDGCDREGFVGSEIKTEYGALTKNHNQRGGLKEENAQAIDLVARPTGSEYGMPRSVELKKGSGTK